MSLENPNENNKEIVRNKEILEAIRTEYPKFKDFWNAVMEQVKENKGEVFLGENLSPLNVVRLFASKIQGIKIEMAPYRAEHDENSAAMMPVKTHDQMMNILQGVLGTASDTYYGERNVVDDQGKLVQF